MQKKNSTFLAIVVSSCFLAACQGDTNRLESSSISAGDADASAQAGVPEIGVANAALPSVSSQPESAGLSGTEINANSLAQPIVQESIPAEPVVIFPVDEVSVGPIVSEPIEPTQVEPVVIINQPIDSESTNVADNEPTISAAQPTPTDTTPIDPSARIEALLRDDALDNIVLDDGTSPITDGSWARFSPETTWTWQLLGQPEDNVDVDVYVVDMFAQAEDDLVERLHAQGKYVICYFSAGTFEPWRPDIHFFDDVPMGNPHSFYPDEVWLDVTSTQTAKIMANRMDMAVAVGCDGVELDNVDGFIADTGLGITYEQQLAYQRILANEAHKRNLTVALKNAVEMIPDAIEYFDIGINEACMAWDECGAYASMVAAGKAVFHVEYDQIYINDEMARAQMCARSAEINMRTLMLPVLLDGSFRLSCDG